MTSPIETFTVGDQVRFRPEEAFASRYHGIGIVERSPAGGHDPVILVRWTHFTEPKGHFAHRLTHAIRGTHSNWETP